MKIVGIIPARYASTRFPGKPLIQILGKSMIQHVYEKAIQSRHVDQFIVATDDQRIFDAVAGFGGVAAMTSTEHKTGTDRIAEVARNLDAEVIINIQGDEPLITPEVIDSCLNPLIEDPSLLMSTVGTPIDDNFRRRDPNVVKVVIDQNGYALYFSRSEIPFRRNETDVPTYRHIGIYGYRREFLLQYAVMPQTPIERTESLEQMRALENGVSIRVVTSTYEPIGVDSPEDVEIVEKRLLEGK